ncbi:MAG: glycosyltransferase family 39 protein [Myxococcota bacterium]|nr:glycosyltransferase family 39 protein [Myxococcota bacterium]
MSRPWPPSAVLLGGLAAAVAAYFAFAFSGTSLWLDEAYSVLLARASTGELVTLLRADNGPPLYYALLGGWMALFGDGERAVRALSGVAYLATGGVLFEGGRRLFRSPVAGVLAATLFWISPLAVRHASSARMYALLGLVTAGSVLLFLGSTRPGQPTRTRLWTAVGLNTLGLLLQYWFLFALFAQGVSYLLLWRRRARWTVLVPLLAPLPLFGALWGWVLVDQLGSGSSAWFQPVGWRDLLATFLDFYGSWITVAAFGLFAGVLLFRWSGRPVPRTRQDLEALAGGGEGRALLLICLLSVLVPWLLSHLKPIYLVGRYTLIALPPFALWLGGALGRAVRPLAAVGLVLPLLLIRLLATHGDQTAWARRDQVESSRASARQLLTQVPQGAQLLYTGLGGLTLGYYLERGGRTLAQHTFPSELALHPGWYDPGRLSEAALSTEAEALVRSLPSSAELWHVHEQGDPAARILEQTLRRTRGPAVREQPLPGSFHDRAVIYGPAR